MSTSPKPDAKLPDEPRRLAVVLCGRRQPEFWGEHGQGRRPALDFFDLKGVVEALAADLHLPAPTYRRSSAACLHPGKAAELVAGGRAIGYFGELHPKTAEAFDLAGRAVLVGEFDLEALQAVAPARHGYTPVPAFPGGAARRGRDRAGIDAGRPGGRRRSGPAAATCCAACGCSTCTAARASAAGRKSLAYALTYQADDRTLTDKEVDKAHKKIQDRLGTSSRRIRGED